MKMTKRYFHVLALSTIVFSLIAPIHVRALSPKELTAQETKITFSDLGQKDMNVKVIYEQEFVDFPIAGGLNIERAVLNMHMQHSEKLLSAFSDIVIAVNNEPVADLILTPENAGDAIQSIEIPVEALRPGENELLLRFNQRLVDNGCSDVNDKDLWTKIFSDSFINFLLAEVPEPTDLALFPIPFSTFSFLPGSPQISMLLPANPSPAELSASVRIAASLGQAANWKKPPLYAFTVNNVDQTRLASDALIAISTGSNNPLISSNPPGVSVIPSPYNPNQLMLIVSGVDDTDLLRSVSMLTTLSARKNLSGSSAAPQDVVPQSLPSRATQSKFSEVGLTTKLVRGIGLHDLYYPIDIPYDWKTTSDATVEVQFQHGAAITSASLMTTYINGFETASIRLDSRNDDNGRLVIQLSPRQIHPGRNWLHIVFDLHMPRENCKFRYFEEAWAAISAENSTINLAHVNSLAPLDLQFIPSFLVIPNDLSSDLFVVPIAPTTSDLTAMVRIAAKLGTYSTTDTILPQATSADKLDLNKTPANVIAIGTPETNSLIMAFDSQLPQPLTLINGQIAPVEGRALLPEELSGQVAYLEVATAPWSRTSSFVVLTARDPAMLLRLVDIFPTGGRQLATQGNLAIVTVDKVTGLSLGNFSGTSLPPSTRRMVSGIFIGALVLITITGGLIVFLKRKRS